MTPIPDQAHRSHAKTWLLKYATPSALRDIYESLANTDAISRTDDQYLNRHMIAGVYFTLTGKEIDP